MTALADYPRGPGHHQIERRMARILHVAALLYHSPGEWTRVALAERFAVSERGIDRDLEILRGLGYVIRRKGRAGYEIEISADLPPPPPAE